MYKWTSHQEELFKAIYDAVSSKQDHLIKVDAVAGASKSSSLIEATRRVKQDFPETKVQYLVFGTANAIEARSEFGTNAIASTLHSLAYTFTVKPHSLNPDIASFLTWQNIPKHVKIPFGETPNVLNTIEAYCTSQYLSFDEYEAVELAHDNKWLPQLKQPINEILNLMATGKMRVTHSFYLKLFHIMVMLNRTNLPKMDILLVDEAQDLTPITLDIVHKFPARVKVLVGDKAQAIYGFMGCISAFDFYKNVGTTLHLPKSFRVSAHIATYIQSFCQTTFDPDMQFVGMDYPDNPPIKTQAYITRTNSELIGRMIQLNQTNTPYKLASTAKINQIFGIPKAILLAKPGGKQYNKELNIIQDAVNEWGSSPSLQQSCSKTSYVAKYCKDIPAIADAVALIGRYGPESILQAFEKAEQHKRSAANLTLLTAHTSKGLTFDKAVLSEGMNEAIEMIMKNKSFKHITTEERAELFLYYVATSRARHELENARFIFNN